MRPLLAALAGFDLALGLAAVAAPGLLGGLLWPAAAPAEIVLLQRTGVIWLAFAFAQALAWRRPSPERLRLVAFLRWMDVPADATWLLAADGLSALGTLSIGAAPLFNLAVGAVCWRAAAAMAAEEPRG